MTSHKISDINIPRYHGGEEVRATPAKTFFTRNLTRDIELLDAILDLLDNCVDGITRSLPRCPTSEERPFAAFCASIDFDSTFFSIEDNCGGIPLDLATNYAFCFGRSGERPTDNRTVGVYGIGMKRAIFKIGSSAKVVSQCDSSMSFTVDIPEDWAESPDWSFPLKQDRAKLTHPGTRIIIGKLHADIADELSNQRAFQNRLSRAIKQYYGRTLAKGFRVRVNGIEIEGEDFRLLVPSDFLRANRKRSAPSATIMPYLFEGEFDGVQVKLACGFYAPFSGGETNPPDESVKRTSDNAGWTISCNDRVVVYNDKTELTGWGTQQVPRFHSQFRAFAGLAQFSSADPQKLPMQTTKRGIDANSHIFLQVREHMTQGMRLFMDFTNKWKTDARVANCFKDTELASFESIEAQRESLLRNVRNRDNQRQFKPSLAVPPVENPSRYIRFTKPLRQIKTVAKFFDLNPEDLHAVGLHCFEYVYSKARR